MFGKGYEDRFLSENEIREILDSALASARLNGKRVLIIIPDSTRTAPIPQMFRLFYEALGKEVAALDYLIALGTHKPMDQEAIDRLVGITPTERQGKYAGRQSLQSSLGSAGDLRHRRPDHSE